MVPIKDLHPGDRVKIVDQFKPYGAYRHATPVSDMRKFLGKTATIQRTERNAIARLEEDGAWWAWDPEMLDYIVEDTPIVLASEADFLSLLASA